MIHATPSMDDELSLLLSQLDGLRQRLGVEVGRSVPWDGTIRRQARYQSISSSTEIEGYHVDEATGMALTSGQSPAERATQDQWAVACYARAMDHVTVMATDPVFRWLDRVILDLHFDACVFQRDKLPGRWRDGGVWIRGSRGAAVYEAPAAGEIVSLMSEVVEWLEYGDLDAHVVVRAAMAHLHVVSVHPFKDGNGRTSRLVQSLVLAREGLLSPEFGSIEPYLAADTQRYFAQLRDAQQGVYDPTASAREWVRFCIGAHIDQATERLAMYERAAQRWGYFAQLVDDRDWPDRMVIALEHAAFGGVVRAAYAAEADIHVATANNDLRSLVGAEFLVQEGRGPATRYVLADMLRDQIERLI